MGFAAAEGGSYVSQQSGLSLPSPSVIGINGGGAQPSSSANEDLAHVGAVAPQQQLSKPSHARTSSSPPRKPLHAFESPATVPSQPADLELTNSLQNRVSLFI